jgi:hypothetical protein
VAPLEREVEKFSFLFLLYLVIYFYRFRQGGQKVGWNSFQFFYFNIFAPYNNIVKNAFCGSSNVVRDRNRGSRQMYKCKDCSKQFISGYKLCNPEIYYWNILHSYDELKK